MILKGYDKVIHLKGGLIFITFKKGKKAFEGIIDD